VSHVTDPLADEADTALEMTRIFWIVGLSITVLMFSLMAIICLAGLIMRRHLSLNAWTMLILSISSAYFVFGRLRAAIRHGDPTKGLDV
jgi:hypothetical protein